MIEKQKIFTNLYQNYSEFVQFLNDYHLCKSLSIFLIYLPSLTIFADLFTNIGQGHILTNLCNLNITSFVFDLRLQMSWLFTLVIVMTFIFLLMPIIMLLIIIINTAIFFIVENEQIGYFINIYMNSMVCKLIRIYFVFYQKVFFPVISSFGIKFMINDEKHYNPGFGITFLTLSLINSFIYDFYTLQIPSTKQVELQYKQINFPYVILENILVLTTIILVNTTSGIVPFICCVCLFSLRLITSSILKFQTGEFYYQSRFALFCGIGISLAFCIAYYTSQYSIMSLCACIVIGLLLINKKNAVADDEQYKKINTNDQITIKDIKMSFSKQNISNTFRNAVLISRRKNTHRQQLTIKILQNKCYHLDRESRGSIKAANSLLLLEYEQRIVKIVKKFFIIQENAIEVLNIMKCKQPKKQLLIKTVIQLVNLIHENKVQFRHCMNIYLHASELVTLIQLFFRQLYNDYIFIRETTNQFNDEPNSSKNKIVQKQLFNKDTALIVINVLDEVGKIKNVSNNMPNVLGYTASSLIGLSINELIPLTVRKQHDEVLTKFVERFTSDAARKKPLVQFFAYTKSFHLQKIQIRYNFFLHLFQDCLLAGIIRKTNTQDYLIMTDRYGNIEGWTPSVGQLFNFDEIAGTQCNAYNIFPLIPAFIKLDINSPMCFKTVFFRLSTMKTSKLMLFDFMKFCPDRGTLAKKQIEVFLDLLQKGQIIEGFFAYFEIEIVDLQFYEKSSLKIIRINQIKKIQNFQILESAILGKYPLTKNQSQFRKQFNFTPDLVPEKSIQQSQDTDYSIKTSTKVQMVIDLNFTLDPSNPNSIDPSHLKFNKDLQKFQNIYSSRSLLKIQLQEQENQNKYTNENLTIQSTFDPKIQRKSNYILVIIALTAIVIGILIQDQISLSVVFQKMNKNRTQLAKAHRAQVIYLKTVFNPNLTYISQFKNGSLIISTSWLLQEKMTYHTYDNVSMQQNMFYILNVQIPSIVDRIYSFSGGSSVYQKQLIYNFNNMVLLYESIYFRQKQIWSIFISEKKRQNIYKTISLALSSIIYLSFLVFIHKRYQNQRKMTEAFFKFQKSDLDRKIQNIKVINKVVQKRCQDWFIDQQISQIKKHNVKKQQTIPFHQTTNSIKRFGNPNNPISQQQINQKKAQAEVFNEIQTQLYKKRFYYMIGLIVVVSLTQILFLILYGIINKNILTSLEDIIWKYNEAYLLTVYPNLKIANLFIPSPPQILQQYEQSVKKVLEQTTQYLPDLFYLLSQTPCKNCTFMHQILNTNYRSFYSYFIQIMQNYNRSSSNLTELFYAVDVVVENVSQVLAIKSSKIPNFIFLIWVFSVIIFFVSVFMILRKLEEQCQKLQYFLKFFDMETLLKNKHMSTIMAKNT